VAVADAGKVVVKILFVAHVFSWQVFERQNLKFILYVLKIP
jgi:hypothetical protein